MPLITEMFDQHKVDIIKRYLQRETDKGRPKDFEVEIDGFKVVSRTNDIEEFDDYEQEVSQHSRNLTITVYGNVNGNRNTRYSFTLQGEPVRHSNTPGNGLGELDQVIAQKMEEKEREYEVQRLKSELSDTKSQLVEAEEFAESLQNRIKDMEDKRYTNAISLGEVASVVLKTLVKQHASRIPGGQALAGLLGADVQDDVNATIAPPTSMPVTFERQADSSSYIDEQTRNRLSLIEQMQQRFNEQQMIGVFSVIDALAASPEKIEGVLIHMGLHPSVMSTAA